jgi:HEAT repeat protein
MDKIIAEIRRLEARGDNDELGEYLIDLVKYGEDSEKYELEFKKHLDSSDWQLRKAALFCLLFALQIDRPEYKEKAMQILKNKSEDEEVRRWAASGLAQTYQRTKHKELLGILLAIVNDPDDNGNIKGSILSSALLIFGLSSREQFLQTNHLSPSLSILIETFSNELNEINKIIE